MVKSDKIRESIETGQIEEITSQLERIRYDIEILKRKENKISEKIAETFRQMFGDSWKNYLDLVREVEEQKKLEDNALNVWTNILLDLTLEDLRWMFV